MRSHFTNRDFIKSAAVRGERQRRMRNWIVDRWGTAAMSPAERAERLFEEVCELMQAEGIEPGRLVTIARLVYSKPPGQAPQEVGGISTCLLAYCDGRALDADALERAELERIEGLSVEHFRERHARKVAEGLALDVAGDAP